MMKKHIGIVVLWCLTLVFMVSCADKDIPAAANTFINKYFPQASVVLVAIDTDEDDGSNEYSVWLNDGTKIEFDMQGSMRKIARNKTGVPAAIMPTPITTYLKSHYPNDVVTKFSHKAYGYKVELSNDMDVRFSHKGKFLQIVD